MAEKAGHTPQHPELADKDMPGLTSGRPRSHSNHRRCEGTARLETRRRTLPTRVPSISMITSIGPPRSCPPCVPQPARGWQAKAQRSGGRVTCKAHRRGS